MRSVPTSFETVGRTAAADTVPIGQRGTRPLVVYHCEPYTAHIPAAAGGKPLADWLERKFMLHPEVQPISLTVLKEV